MVYTHVDELVEVWYPLDGVADDEYDGDGQADLGQSQLLLSRRAADTATHVARRRGGAWVTTLALEYQIRLIYFSRFTCIIDDVGYLSTSLASLTLSYIFATRKLATILFIVPPEMQDY